MQDLLTTIAITAYISSVAVVSIVSSTVVTAARWCSVPLVIWVRPAAIAVAEKSVRCDDLFRRQRFGALQFGLRQVSQRRAMPC